MVEPMGDPDPQDESTRDPNNLFDNMDAKDQLLAMALLQRGGAFLELAGDRGSTPLHIAAERGREKVVNFLLLQGPPGEHPDLLQQDHEGDTPQHIAAGNFKIFKLLFPANHDIGNVRNKKGQTLLHYAAGKNNPKVVDFLLNLNSRLKSAKDDTGATPFHFAARSGSRRYVMDKLMNNVDETNKDGLTALHYAARNGHKKVVLWLLEKGASVFRADLKKKNTPLHWVAINKSLEFSNGICLAQALIEKAADVFFLRNVDGKFPVELAYDLHNYEAVKIICKAMVTSQAFKKYDGWIIQPPFPTWYYPSLPFQESPARYQTHRDNALYTNIDHMAWQDNGTLLHYVAAYGTEKDIKLVLEQILSLTARNQDGKEENYRLNVNRVDSKGQNAFHWAAREGNTEVIQVLKSYNVDPLLRDTENITPLCRAIIGENVKFAETLLGELENLTAEDWTNMVNIWIDKVQYVFDQQILQQIKREVQIQNADDPQLLWNMIEKAVLAELPPIYKALCAGKQEIAKLIQKQSKGVFEFVNSKGKITGMSALHWATILKQKRIVSLLCNIKELSDDLVADVVDVHGKTPLDYSTDMEIMTELKMRDEVKYYVEGLYRDRQVYVDITNAILQGAAITAGITFEKWLYRPHDEKEGEILCWICNNLAFFCAIATVFAGTCTMSVPNSDITKAVTSNRKALILAVVLLGMSIGFVVTASIVGLALAHTESPSFTEKYAALPSYMICSLLVGIGVCFHFTHAFAGHVSPKDVPSHTYFSVISALIFPLIMTKASPALPSLSFQYQVYMGICVVVLLLFGFLRSGAARPSLPLPSATTHTEGGQARAAGPADVEGGQAHAAGAAGPADVVVPAYYTLGKRYQYIAWDDGLDHLNSLPEPHHMVGV